MLKKMFLKVFHERQSSTNKLIVNYIDCSFDKLHSLAAFCQSTILSSVQNQTKVNEAQPGYSSIACCNELKDKIGLI